jgi:hypothetical protein
VVPDTFKDHSAFTFKDRVKEEFFTLDSKVGQDITVGIASRYGLNGLGIESLWRQNFLHLSRQAFGPTQSPIEW